MDADLETTSPHRTPPNAEYLAAMAAMQHKLAQITVERDEARATCVRLCHEASQRDYRVLQDDRKSSGSRRSWNGGQPLGMQQHGTHETQEQKEQEESIDTGSSNATTTATTTTTTTTLTTTLLNHSRPIPSFSKTFEELLGYVPESTSPNVKDATDELLFLASPKRSKSPEEFCSQKKRAITSRRTHRSSNHSIKRKVAATPTKTPTKVATPRRVRHAQWEGDRNSPRRLNVVGIVSRNDNREECNCPSKTRLVGLMRQHEQVHQRLKAVVKQQRSVDKMHAVELARVRKEVLKGPEAALERLELQNARLRRIIIMAQSQSGGMDQGFSLSNGGRSFTATPSVPPPLGPPPTRTGRRRRGGRDGSVSASRNYTFSVTTRQQQKTQQVTEVGGEVLSDSLKGISPSLC